MTGREGAEGFPWEARGSLPASDKNFSPVYKVSDRP
jgi:hypothetical protein